MSDAKTQTSAPAPAEAIWAAALADGSGRHVPVRKHWPELAAALDAAVDGAVWDICSRCGEDEHPIPDWATWCMGCLDETGTATPAGAVPDTGQSREPMPNSLAVANRIIREAWQALPGSVLHLVRQDGATLAGCIRAIPPAPVAARCSCTEEDRTT